MRIGSLVVLVWLLIGVVAAAQRGYFGSAPEVNCKTTGTIAVTVLAGPLNYLGANPKISNCKLPQPSQ